MTCVPAIQTVLIIDDEPEYRKLLAEMLKANGWDVVEADHGEKGVELARLHRPAVVLCDLLMPRCNGFQVCRTLRSDGSLNKLKIVVTSGREFGSDRQEAIKCGADEYLVKPLDLGQLVDLLGKYAMDAAPPPESIEGNGDPSSPAYVKFWGVRGSIPTPGPSTVSVGGNTTCVEVRADGQIIILDAGSGLRLLGQALVKEFRDQPIKATLLLTHTHWDHIQGIPFFPPVYGQQNHLRILGYEGAKHGLQNVLSNQMESPFFPVGLGEVPANLIIEELKEMHFEIGAVKAQAMFANHPGICVGYRLFTSGGSVAFFPDNELHIGHRKASQLPGREEGTAMAFARTQDRKLIEFLRGTDVLIMDTQYDCEEYKSHVGWGHGCVDDVVALAIEAQIQKLFLFHHDPNHDDAKVAEMEKHARAYVQAHGGSVEVQAAREGNLVRLTAAH